MAGVIVSPVVEEVVARLASVLDEEFRLLWGFKSDIVDLQSKFSSIRVVVEDAEAKQRKNKAIEDWLRKLRAACFEMENLLDEVSTEAMIRRVEAETGDTNRQVAAFFSDRNPFVFRLRMAYQLKNIRIKLAAIATEKSEFLLEEGVSQDKGVDIGDMEDRITSSFARGSEIVGREAEKEMIIERICHENLVDDGDEVSVYAVWGVGGIGKTTLCQMVYNDERATRRFDMKMWVCVSEDFRIERLTKDILEAVERKPCNLAQLDLLQQRLQERLHGKRFLLVLDNILNGNHAKWEVLKRGLRNGADGSLVLVTTRDVNIARMMAKRTEFIHKVGLLSRGEAWSVFKSFAFSGGRRGGNVHELQPVGEAIVDRCRGLPLALKTLGRVMWSKDIVGEWLSVLESDIWDLPQDKETILPALKLSYDNLPHHYRQCFAFCFVFPKDYKMSKESMIKLWIANKFIPSSREANLYELGEEIFNGLVWRGFFQDVEDSTFKSANRVTCRMHDLFHDLARSVIGHECSTIEHSEKLKLPAEVLHISSFRGLPTDEDLAEVTSLRTIFMLVRMHRLETIPDHIFKQRCLRVLYMLEVQIDKLPESICNLKHLRYLNLSGSNITVLPESIVYLQNLQFLNLCGCTFLCKLPKGMRRMRNLLFLELDECRALEKMPSGMGQLGGRLRRLSKFVVGTIDDETEIGQLGGLNLLENKLEIERLENVSGLEEAKGAKLKCKQNLTSLKLSWIGSRFFQEPSGKAEEVLEGLEPHQNLKMLEIFYYSGLKLASWMVNLVNLVELSVFHCSELEILPLQMSDGTIPFPSLRKLNLYNCQSLTGLTFDLPKLEYLHIWMCKSLIELPSNMPMLKFLNIGGCERQIVLPSNLPKLEELSISSNRVVLPDDIGSFPLLRKLSISDCSNLKSLPEGLQNLKTLESIKIYSNKDLSRRCEKDQGDDWSKIAHVPFIMIDGNIIQDVKK